MAKAKKQQSKGKNNGSNNDKGKSRPVIKSIEASDGGRDRKRNARKAAQQLRIAELSSGNFHSRVNEGRSNSIADLLAGKEGLYAIPGQNHPSAHFRVEIHKRPSDQNPEGFDRLPVAYFESAQTGHQLAGRGRWCTNTYAPTFYIEKYAQGFTSRLENVFQKSTQEMIVHFLAKEGGCLGEITEEIREILIEETMAPVGNVESVSKESTPAVEHAVKVTEPATEKDTGLSERIQRAQRKYKKLGDGKFGDYLLPNGVVVSLYDHPKHGAVLSVLHSPEGIIKAGSDLSLKAYTTCRPMFIRRPSIKQDVYEWLKTLHEMIVQYLPEGIKLEAEVKSVGAVKMVEKAIEATTPVVTKTPEVKVVEKRTIDLTAGAVEMSVAMFLGRPGKYFRQVNGKRAFFEVWREMNQMMVGLFAVEEGFDGDHVLARIMREHEDGVHIPLSQKNQIRIDHVDLENLKEKKEARKALLLFLKDLAENTFRVKPKEKRPEATPVVERTISLEMLMKVSGGDGSFRLNT